MDDFDTIDIKDHNLDEAINYKIIKSSVKERVDNLDDAEKILTLEEKGRKIWKIIIALWIVPSLLAIIGGIVYMFTNEELGMMVMAGGFVYLIAGIIPLFISRAILANTLLQPYLAYDKFFRRTSAEEIPELEWYGNKLKILNTPILTKSQIAGKIIFALILILCILLSTGNKIINLYEQIKTDIEIEEQRKTYQESIDNMNSSLERLDKINENFETFTVVIPSFDDLHSLNSSIEDTEEDSEVTTEED